MRVAKSPAELGFNRYDEPRLMHALKRATAKHTFQRVQAVLLVAQGRAVNEVARGAGVSRPTVYNWIPLYLASHQVAALQDAPRRGPSLNRPTAHLRTHSP
jgi:transposase-like protein